MIEMAYYGRQHAMRVMHIMGSLRPSGMEKMLVSGAHHFARHDIQNIVVGQGTDHPFESELRDVGYTVRLLPRTRDWRGVMAMRHLVAELEPDVVHIHTESAFAATVLSVKSASTNVPVVRTIHSSFEFRGITKVKRRVQARVADRHVAYFVAPSPDVQQIEKEYGRTLELIFNWVDDRYSALAADRAEYCSSVPDRCSILIVGNSAPVKNHQMVLEAIVDLPVDLYFHGDESNANEVERSILDRLESEGRLKHRGTSDPTESLIAATAFVLPSRREGMSVSLAEALTAGIPSYVNDVSGLRWARTVRFVTMVPNEPCAWRDTMSRLAHQGVVSCKPVEPTAIDFSAARGVQEYADLYTAAIGRNKYRS